MLPEVNPISKSLYINASGRAATNETSRHVPDQMARTWELGQKSLSTASKPRATGETVTVSGKDTKVTTKTERPVRIDGDSLSDRGDAANNTAPN